jgi:hypothetical protein
MVVSKECAMKQEQKDAASVSEDIAAPKPSGSDQKQADPQPSGYDFHPIRIKGEPLSATIIRERRERPW